MTTTSVTAGQMSSSLGVHSGDYVLVSVGGITTSTTSSRCNAKTAASVLDTDICLRRHAA
jgi:hypothetical protein